MQRSVIIAAVIAVTLLSAKPSTAAHSPATTVPEINSTSEQLPALSPAFETMKGRRRADDVQPLLF